MLLSSRNKIYVDRPATYRVWAAFEIFKGVFHVLEAKCLSNEMWCSSGNVVIIIF